MIKWVIQKTAEGTGDLTGNEIAKRISKVLKHSETIANHKREL